MSEDIKQLALSGAKDLVEVTNVLSEGLGGAGGLSKKECVDLGISLLHQSAIAIDQLQSRHFQVDIPLPEELSKALVEQFKQAGIAPKEYVLKEPVPAPQPIPSSVLDTPLEQPLDAPMLVEPEKVAQAVDELKEERAAIEAETFKAVQSPSGFSPKAKK